MKTGEHIIIDFSVRDVKNIDTESVIDKFLFDVTELAGMTLAIPPVSFKFPVDNAVIENCRESLKRGHLGDADKQKVFSVLQDRARSGKLGGSGVSGTAIWVESHCAVHTWTNERFVTVDMFSCRNLELKKVLDFAKGYFSIENGRYLKLERFTDKAPVIEKGAIYDDT